jgi:hypothetical protein
MDRRAYLQTTLAAIMSIGLAKAQERQARPERLLLRSSWQTVSRVVSRDTGLGDWLFDFDQQDGVARFVPVVLSIAKDSVAA